MAGLTSPSTRISAYYTWSPYPVIPPASSPLFDVPFPFVPMLWRCNDTYTQPFLSALSDDFSGVVLTGERVILGSNEPDIPSQASCTTQNAADAWMQVLEPLRAQGYRVGSPAVTNGDGGTSWIQEWLKACDTGGVTRTSLRYIGQYELDSGDFIHHMKEYYDTFGRPIWVTEYTVQDFTNTTHSASLTDIQRFVHVTSAWMDSVDYVECYFWFGAMYDMQGVNPLNALLDPAGAPDRTGALSALGVQYAGSNGSVTNGTEIGASPTQTTSCDRGGKVQIGVVGLVGMAMLALLAVNALLGTR